MKKPLRMKRLNPVKFVVTLELTDNLAGTVDTDGIPFEPITEEELNDAMRSLSGVEYKVRSFKRIKK